MIDPDWNPISDKAFPHRTAKAPPYLWTRILARIEELEALRDSVWWMQWRWMGKVVAITGLVVAMAIFFFVEHDMAAPEKALEAHAEQQQSLEMANSDVAAPEESAIILTGFDS